VACATVVRKAADVRLTIFRKSFIVIKINELSVTSSKLTSNFAGLVTSSLEVGVAAGPAGPR
jgi:hypothetical protein